LCCSSLTPGLLNPSFKPLGLLNTGFSSPGFTGPVFVFVVVFGFGPPNGFLK